MMNMGKSKAQKPIIGISMGDPFGNGPEITVKALAGETIWKCCRPIVIGDASCLRYASKIAEKVSNIHVDIHPVSQVTEAKFTPGVIDVIDMKLVNPGDIPDSSGEVHPEAFHIGPSVLGGEAAFQYVVKLIQLAQEHRVDGTVTNAISKEAINMACQCNLFLLHKRLDKNL